jgi:hypothetical protein
LPRARGSHNQQTNKLPELILQNEPNLLVLGLVHVLIFNVKLEILKLVLPMSRPEAEEKIKEGTLVLLAFEALSEKASKS